MLEVHRKINTQGSIHSASSTYKYKAVWKNSKTKGSVTMAPLVLENMDKNNCVAGLNSPNALPLFPADISWHQFWAPKRSFGLEGHLTHMAGLCWLRARSLAICTMLERQEQTILNSHSLCILAPPGLLNPPGPGGISIHLQPHSPITTNSTELC